MLLRGSATACHNMCTLQCFFSVLLLFVNSPTASSSFPSAFSTTRHGLGSIKGLVTGTSASSSYLSDISIFNNDLFASDVDYARARRNNNKFMNINFDDWLLTNMNSASSPTSYTSPSAIVTTFSTSAASPDLSSTPHARARLRPP